MITPWLRKVSATVTFSGSIIDFGGGEAAKGKTLRSNIKTTLKQ
jgi:hypothetical protein